jgi:renal tumor antigen
MDLWGAGCVMFEITSLYPLFPGSNEVDQISRIHKVLGTPSQDILEKFRSKGASNISFDFPPQKAIGIPQLIPHATPECIDLIVKLLKYDASERITAREAMRHPYFKESRDSEAKTLSESATLGAANSGANISASNTMSNANTDIIKVNPYNTTQNASSNSGAVKPLPNIMGSSVNDSSAALYKMVHLYT